MNGVKAQGQAIRKLLRRKMKTNLGAAWTEWKLSFYEMKRHDRANRFCASQLRSKAFAMLGQYAIMKQQRRGLLNALISRRDRLLAFYGFLQLKSACKLAGTRARVDSLLVSKSVVNKKTLEQNLKKVEIMRVRRALKVWCTQSTKRRIVRRYVALTVCL